MGADVARDQALLQGMAVASGSGHSPGHQRQGAASSQIRTLHYAMGVLGDCREISDGDGAGCGCVSDFAELLESNNIAYRSVQTPARLHHNMHGVLIAFADDDGRPLVVHRRFGQTLVFDGISGQRQPLRADQPLKPYAFELYAALPASLHSLSAMLRFAGSGHGGPLLTVLFSALVVAGFNLCIPLLTMVVVGRVLPHHDLGLIVGTSLLVLLVLLSSVIAQGFSSLAAVRMESLVNLRLEAALWNHLLRLPLQLIQRLGSSDLVMRVASIAEMRQLISSGLLSTLLGLLLSLSTLVLLVLIDAQLAVVALALSLLGAVLMVLLSLKAWQQERPMQEGLARLGEQSLQAVMGLPQLRVYGTEPFVFERWITELGRLGDGLQRGAISSDSLAIVARLLGPVGQVLLFFALVMRLSPALPSPNLVAAVVAFQAGYLAFSSQLTALASQVARTVARLIELWRRATVLMVAEPEPGLKVPSGVRQALVGHVQLQSLQLRYPDAAIPLLSDISLTVMAGSYTAITGPSGCGKSSLIRCLLRLIEPDAGSISIDGVDLRDLAIRHYRRQLGVVLQNAALPSGSIVEVVRAGRPFSRDAVWDALERAAVADDVQRMPMRLETILGEGAPTISGGQRQRLCLARALLGQPRMLLLDEATSALDATTQAAVTRTLETLSITRIAVAHRRSTLESADQIAVLGGGGLRALGSYDAVRHSLEGRSAWHGH